MPDGRDIICTFDSSFDGFLSAIYHIIKNRIRPVAVLPEGCVQTCLDANIIHVPFDSYKSDKVRRAICESMEYDGFKRTYYAFLNSDKDSATAVYKYLLYGFKYGKKTANYISLPDISRAYELARAVTREVDKVQGFLRFSVMEGGVEYAPFEPVHDILALIVPHFTDRLKYIPFVIHDVKREKAAVYTTKEWFITDASGLTVPALSPEEKNYRELWKDFYRAVTIKDRKNPRLQTQMLPKMYRRHMTEFL